MAAIAAVDGLVPYKCVRAVAARFQGVEHRIELVRELDGVKYYNDSIGTSPSRTVACLESFPEPVILIAGGYDKGIPFHASLLVNYGWLLITLYCMVKLLGSNFGNIFKAIRDDEIAAKVMGIDTFRTKVLSFCLGAFFAGVGGALLGNLLTTIDPKMFTFLLTFNVLMIVVAGGLGSLTGSILGSAVITVLLEWLRAVEDPITLGGFAIPGIPGMRMVVFSLVLLCIILYRREGIMGMREITWDAIFDFFSRRKRA